MFKKKQHFSSGGHKNELTNEWMSVTWAEITRVFLGCGHKIWTERNWLLLSFSISFSIVCSFYVFSFLFYFVFWAFMWRLPAQGSNQSCSHQPMPQPQKCKIQAKSVTYTTAHINARSLTHWVRPGIELPFSRILAGLVNLWAMAGLPIYFLSNFSLTDYNELLICLLCVFDGELFPLSISIASSIMINQLRCSLNAFKMNKYMNKWMNEVVL